MGAATGAKGIAYEALRGASRLLVMEDPNELPEVAHTELLKRVPKQFLGTSKELLEEAPRGALE